MNEGAFLFALQLSDSWFPNGAFSHSGGLESYISQGIISSASELQLFVESYLKEVLLNSDLLILRLTFYYAQAGNLEKILYLDRILRAVKSARESQESSTLLGARTLKNGHLLIHSTLLATYYKKKSAGMTPGNQAVVFALLAEQAGLPMIPTCIAFLYTISSGLINAGLKLIPLGQSQGQLLMRSISPTIVEVAQKVQGLEEEDLGAFAPAWDIRVMQHERLYSRLFMS